MWNLQKLKVENLFSFGNTEIEFPDGKVLVLGDNRDSDGSSSNGAGKTSFFDAVSWIVFGLSSKKLHSDEVLWEKGQDKAERGFGELTLNTNGHLISIRRELGKSYKSKERGDFSDCTGGRLLVMLDGEDKSRRTDTQTQEFLLEFFGNKTPEQKKSSHDDFLCSTYLSAGEVAQFASDGVSSSERMTRLSRFLSLRLLEQCVAETGRLTRLTEAEIQKKTIQADVLKGSLVDEKEIKSNLKDFEEKLDLAQKNLGTVQNELEKSRQKDLLTEKLRSEQSAKVLLGSSHKKELDLIQHQETVNTEDLESLSEKGVKLEGIQRQLEKIDIESIVSRINEKEDRIKDLRKKEAVIDTQIPTLNSKVTFSRGQLEKAQNCPQCKVDLMVVDGDINLFDPTELKEAIEKAEKELESLRNEASSGAMMLGQDEASLTEVKEWAENYRDLKSQEKGLIDFLGRKDSLTEEISNLKERKKSLETDFASKSGLLAGSISNFEREISDLGDVRDFATLRNQEGRLQSDIGICQTGISNAELDLKTNKKVKEDVAKLEDEIKLDHEDLELLGIWKEGFPTVRRWVIESFLPTWETLSNSLLMDIGSELRVGFDTITEKKSGGGEFKQEFSVILLDGNLTKRRLVTYSDGEQKRAAVCVALAQRELAIQRGIAGFSFFLADQIADSLDPLGVQEFFELLDKIDGQKFVISHSDEMISRFENVITIVKEDGKSKIVKGRV